MYDAIVCGGGISGLGAAWALSAAGFSVAVLERGRICGATSSQSLRIIHGGFRYLQQGNILRVIQSMDDQEFLLRNIPEAVKPLPCIMPLQKSGMKSPVPAMVGAWVFRTIRAVRRVGATAPPRVLTANEVAQSFPGVSTVAPHGALYWEDAAMSDQGRVSEWVSQKIVRHGGEIHEQVKVQAVRVGTEGVLIECDGGKSFRSNVAVNCLGPWVHGIEGTPERGTAEQIKWCRAFNVVFDTPSPCEVALGIQSSAGRLFFLTPRGKGCALGTEYLWCNGGPDQSNVSEEEVSRFLKEFSHVFPGARELSHHVSGTEVGVLPAGPGTVPTPLGTERIRVSGRYVEVLSTKYTTFRSQGLNIRRIVGEVLGR